MSTTLKASLEERIDRNVLQRVREDVNAHAANQAATQPLKRRLAQWLEDVLAKRLGERQIGKLAQNRGRVKATWGELPRRMHLVANQTRLMLELIDDFRSGEYRKVPWHSLAICGAAILYAVNPADLLPDALLGLGVFDDIAVAALAARVLRSDLVAYCEFKGYPIDEYFPSEAARESQHSA